MSNFLRHQASIHREFQDIYDQIVQTILAHYLLDIGAEELQKISFTAFTQDFITICEAYRVNITNPQIRTEIINFVIIKTFLWSKKYYQDDALSTSDTIGIIDITTTIEEYIRFKAGKKDIPIVQTETHTNYNNILMAS